MAKNGSCINNFTGVTEFSKNCIDHMFVKNIETNQINSNVLRCDISDHWNNIGYI